MPRSAHQRHQRPRGKNPFKAARPVRTERPNIPYNYFVAIVILVNTACMIPFLIKHIETIKATFTNIMFRGNGNNTEAQ